MEADTGEAGMGLDIDFATVKALSSKTRVKILHAVMDLPEARPTAISDAVDKAKSTVATHLDRLEDAELVEKTAAAEQKRVIYTVTPKGRSIIQGSQRRMRFALGTGVLALMGAGITYVQRPVTQRSADVGIATAEAATSVSPWFAAAIMFLGVIGAASFVVAAYLRRLNP